MKKLAKILIFSLLIILVLSNSVHALTLDSLTGDPGNAEGIKDAGGKIITVISVMGSLVSVIVLIALGIKYMIGSVEEKAQYKKTLLPYVIGATFVFAGSTIAGIIYGIINQ